MRQLSLLSTIASTALRLSTISRSASLLQLRACSAVGYVTDIEGNLNYWHKYLEVSKVLRKDADGKIELKDDCQFVYGGDVCDRGSGCLRVMTDLIHLKEKYPEHVHLILGNRDINKLRIQSSMHPSVLRCYPRTYWVKPSETELAASGYALNDPESKMKWILAKSMGAPLAYTCRRHELQDLQLPSRGDAPWRSFLEMTDPERGLLTRYLELGQIAARIGDTLFVHGAVHEHSTGWVPPVRRGEERDLFTKQSLPGAHVAQSARREDGGTSPLLSAGWRAGTVDEWANGINAFLRAEMTDYRRLMPQYLQSLSECASTGTAGHVDGGGARSSAANAAAARHIPASAAVGAGRAEEADVAASSADAAGSIWEAVGGYEHPQPGSRLLQYGMGRLSDGTLNPSVIYSSYLQQRHVAHAKTKPGEPAGTKAAAAPVMETRAVPLSAKTAQWLRQGGVSKVVVGHQPVGDAPHYMAAHGVQMFSMDTSYSKNVQWPTRQLREFASANTTPHEQEHASREDYWTTHALFEESEAKAREVANKAGAGAGCSSGAGNTAPASDNSTRAPRAGFEVIFQPETQGGVKNRVARESTVRVTGYLSSGCQIDCTYPSVQTDGDRAEAEAFDPFIGKTTDSGWTVRAAGIYPGHRSRSRSRSRSQSLDADEANRGADRGQEYYLLSSVEGYTFRNRLVPVSEISREFL